MIQEEQRFLELPTASNSSPHWIRHEENVAFHTTATVWNQSDSQKTHTLEGLPHGRILGTYT